MFALISNQASKISNRHCKSAQISSCSRDDVNIEAKLKKMLKLCTTSFSNHSNLHNIIQSSNFQFGCAIVVMSKQAMASVILSLLHRYSLLALDGDIHVNPGPVPAQKLVSSPQGNSCFSLPSCGLRIGQWNVNRLNETKFEQVQIEILGHDYNEVCLDILFIS